MLKVNEILQLSLFKNFTYLAGEEGLDNSVIYVAILEYESVKNGFEEFGPGAFVLASLFFSKDAPDVYDTLRTIIKKKVAAVCLKATLSEDIPEDIVTLAEENKVPLYVFSNAYMEDLIIGINESLKTNSQYLIYEEKLHSIIHTTPHSHEVRTIAKDINPAFCPYIISAYITPTDELSSMSINAYFKRLAYTRIENQETSAYTLLKYNAGIMLIFSFEKENFPDSEQIKNLINSLLAEFDFDKDSLQVGISDQITPLKNMHVSLQQSIYANYVCRSKNMVQETYTNIDILQYLLPMVYDPVIYQHITEQIDLIKKYDKTYSSNLLETMELYIKNNGDIKKTSAEIFQHANTIRYRVKKAPFSL